jgi:Porphobilinogen deaminase
LKRGSHKDIFVPHPDLPDPHAILGMGVVKTNEITLTQGGSKNTKVEKTTYQDTGDRVDAVIATSSIRRIAQWSRRYPNHKIENLRGNINTRLRKLKESNWHGAIFAAAGLERINLRPENSIELDWMLPAPAQGAIMVVCREEDDYAYESCQPLNDEETALCTKIERDFLSGLMGGCSTPISALAQVKDGQVYFEGNVVSPNSYHMAGCSFEERFANSNDLGSIAAKKLLSDGAQVIIDKFKDAAQ